MVENKEFMKQDATELFKNFQVFIELKGWKATVAVGLVVAGTVYLGGKYIESRAA